MTTSPNMNKKLVASKTPIVEHWKAITNQNSSGLSYLDSTTPTPICICMVRGPLKSFNDINANAKITGINTMTTGIGAFLLLYSI